MTWLRPFQKVIYVLPVSFSRAFSLPLRNTFLDRSATRKASGLAPSGPAGTVLAAAQPYAPRRTRASTVHSGPECFGRASDTLLCDLGWLLPHPACTRRGSGRFGLDPVTRTELLRDLA
ncbi:hypothetical protein GCM10027610_051750 [Dactylosporangium cerinum]